MRTRCILGVVILLVTAIFSSRARADMADRLLDLLVRKSVITQDEAQGLREELARETAQETVGAAVPKTGPTEKPGLLSSPGGVEVGYQDNFYLKTSDGNFEIRAAGRVHTDLRFFESSTRQFSRRDSLDVGEPLDSGFQIRRARLGFRGTLWKNYEFKIEGNFSGGGAAMTDGYLNLKHLPWAQVQIGQFKEPFGLENMSSTNYIDFIERSMVATNTGAPLRDIGVLVHGKPWAGQVEYGLGVFNGEGIDSNRNLNDDFEYAGRVVVAPFRRLEAPWLQELFVGASATFGKASTERPASFRPQSFRGRTSTGFDFFRRLETRGDRWRTGAELAWYHGPFSVKGEYIATSEERRNLGSAGGDLPDVDADGWYLGASWLLTGQKKRPTRNEGLELAFRYEELRLDANGVLDGGNLVDQNRARTTTIGLNWYLNRHVRWSANYVFETFERGRQSPHRAGNNLFLGRFHLEY